MADTKRGGFEREPWAETYFPMRQAPDPRAFVLLRTSGDPITLVAAAQAAVWSIDRNQAIASIRTVPELLAQRELNRRFTTLLLGVFASVALVLAIIGTYGVIAHATAQRTQEIGIRIALGADRRTILRMVLAGGLRIAAAGLAIGVFGALALTQRALGPAVRRQRARPADVRRRPGRAAGRGARGLLDPGAPRHAGRAGHCAARRRLSC